MMSIFTSARPRVLLFMIATGSVTLLASLYLHSSVSGYEERVIPWVRSFEQAQQTARQTGKPICVVFR
jgi:hypothetical protein